MIIKHRIHIFQEYLFDIVINLAFFLLIISILGFSQYSQKYLSYLDYYIRIYICLFLIWRFNPLRSSYEFTSLDVKIAFNSDDFPTFGRPAKATLNVVTGGVDTCLGIPSTILF